jgi:putative Ca2+/H+ antiporter (TMEM165/GDT1 family)
VLAGDFISAVHGHRIGDFIAAAGIVGIVAVVLFIAFGIWINSPRDQPGGWRDRGRMG